MTLYTVTITGDATPYEVYGGLTACDHYLLASVSAGAKKYRALAAGGDDRKRLLVQATRWIDDILSALTLTGAGGTTLQVPAENVLNADGSAMSDVDQLVIAERATFEAVAILAANQDAAIAIDQGSNIKRLEGGGSAGGNIEFFRPTSALDGTAPALPPILTRILAPLLAGASGGAVLELGASSGTCRTSSFDDSDRFKRTGPF